MCISGAKIEIAFSIEKLSKMTHVSKALIEYLILI